MNKNKLSIIAFVLCFISISLSAEIKLSSLFTDNMVLQQKSEVAVWGWGEIRTNISIVTSWDNKNYATKSDKNGKWKVMIKTPAAGGPYELTISDDKAITLKNVLIGEVWLCTGQSNMEMPMKGFRGQPVEQGSNMDILKSKNSHIRFISIPRSSKTETQDNFEGQWQEASPETVANFSATGYYFGRLLQNMIDIPVGLIDVTYGGSCVQAWMSKKTAVAFEDTKVPEKGDSIPVKNRTPTVLFNGMLNPVIGYGIKGCIWYQGESNYTEADKYGELFITMVNEWRSLWNIGEFPFYYAQIAPFDYSIYYQGESHEKYNSAYLRDAQRKAQFKIPNSGMVVLMDIGEKNSIHPKKKQVGGERLALIALAKTYHLKGFGYQSPSFKEMSVNGSNVVVSFNETNGLTSFGKEIKGFEIAGEDKHYYPATAFLRSKSVILSSPHVNKPVAIRYAFKNFAEAELFGTDGLPVSSFRTDDW